MSIKHTPHTVEAIEPISNKNPSLIVSIGEKDPSASSSIVINVVIIIIHRRLQYFLFPKQENEGNAAKKADSFRPNHFAYYVLKILWLRISFRHKIKFAYDVGCRRDKERGKKICKYFYFSEREIERGIRGSMRKCEGSGEVAETGVEMSRAVPVASAWASASAEDGRKRKFGCGGELSYATSLVQLKSRRCRVDNDVKPENSTENAEANNSDDPCASCCSSNGSSELDNDTWEFVDLEAEVEEEGSVDIATSTYELENCCREG